MIYRKAETYPTLMHGDTGLTAEVMVFHSTGGNGWKYVHGLFQGLYKRDGVMPITVHFGVTREGVIYEYAPWRAGEMYQCWHAGKSQFEGRAQVSRFALGVEIDHKPGQAFPPEQVEAMQYLVRLVWSEYPDIAWTTHKRIAMPPGRKADPYSPDWEQQMWPAIQEALNQPRNGEEADMTKAEYDALRVSFFANKLRTEAVAAATIEGSRPKAKELWAVIPKKVAQFKQELGLELTDENKEALLS